MIYTHAVVYNIGLVSRMFANDLKDWGSIPGRDILKTQKMASVTVEYTDYIFVEG